MNLSRSRRTSNGGQPEKLVGVAAALGVYDRVRVTDAVKANQKLADEIERTLQRPYDYPYFHDRPPEFPLSQTPEKLAALIPQLRECASSFSDGSPNYVCEQIHACAFCSTSRANNVGDAYRKYAYARLADDNTKFLRIFMGVIRPRLTYDEPWIELDLLRRCCSNIRENLKHRERRAKNRVAFASKSEDTLHQLDFFVHFSNVPVYGDRICKPHIHYIAQMANPYATRGTLTNAIEMYTEKLDLSHAPYPTFDIAKKPTKKQEPVFAFENQGRYCARMLKPHRLFAEDRLEALTAIPKSFYQLTRKNQSKEGFEEIEQTFANPKPIGKHNAYFENPRWIIGTTR